MLIAGCASQLPQHETVILAPGITLNLADPPDSLTADNLQQILLVEHQDEEHTLVAQLDISKDTGIKLIVMTSQGVPIFNLHKPLGEPITSTKILPINDIDARYILADIMLVHWPVTALNKQLNGAVITQENVSRELHNKNIQLITIDSENENTTLINYHRDYKITFKKVN